jgi:hypothetical protein
MSISFFVTKINASGEQRCRQTQVEHGGRKESEKDSTIGIEFSARHILEDSG